MSGLISEISTYENWLTPSRVQTLQFLFVMNALHSLANHISDFGIDHNFGTAQFSSR